MVQRALTLCFTVLPSLIDKSFLEHSFIKHVIYYQAGISLVCTSSRMNWQTHLKIQGKAGIMTISSRFMDLGYLFLVILRVAEGAICS